MSIRTTLLVMALTVTASALAQEPTFTYTSSSGTTLKGHLKCLSQDGKMSVTEPQDGNVFAVDISEVESMVLTKRQPPYTTKCSSYSNVEVVLSDKSKVAGCLSPYEVQFVTPKTTMQSVTTSTGKFVRDKQ